MSKPRWTLIEGDARDAVAAMLPNSIDAVVTDPPYGLNFMGKKWDTGATAFDPEFWALVLAAMKPGAHLVAFSGTRTYHRMVCAIEDAGFEIRDQLGWLYGMGFPKSHDVAKGIDKAAGAVREVVGRHTSGKRSTPTSDIRGGKFVGGTNSGIDISAITEPATDDARQWQGFGTALKPAWEPIVLARKPFKGTVANNVLTHGTGALNIDAGRVGTDGGCAGAGAGAGAGAIVFRDGLNGKRGDAVEGLGRWPANIVHDGSDEATAGFPDGRSRYFYSAKATRADRAGSRHPTVKPVALMRWLVRMVTPPGGTVLDPFAGSGTTGAAAVAESFDVVLIEREAEYAADIRNRLGDNPPPPRKFGAANLRYLRRRNPTSRGGAGTSLARSPTTHSAASGRTIGPIGLKR